MLITVLAFLTAAQAAGPSAPASAAASNAAAAPAQAAPVVKPKKKRRTCSTDEAGLGSHIVMEDCPSDDDLAKQALKGARVFKQSIMNGAPPPGAPH